MRKASAPSASFVELNCAAIPEDYIETELFGYRHNALPGGPPEKRGTFERADSGTLLLDEVGDMSLKTQAKVLRALDEQSFTPRGAPNPFAVDVRVIATTNKNLEEEIANGNFREDLFYRLNVIPFLRAATARTERRYPPAGDSFSAGIGPPVWPCARWRSPPTRCRSATAYLARQCARAEKHPRAHDDPEPATIAHRAEPPACAGRSAAPAATLREFPSLQQAREAYESDFILRKIDDCHGNVSRAAEMLGLERSHLYRKMKALGIHTKEA